ncbi:sigma-54 interaction domain-containing protein [Paludibaculum fermentans]|uniref:Sigma-54-dependent Fis family transcriptional regulator n=1 Tax=Paludibaculum fermentans TaxID=1473598 RepID=A0A7S7SNM2_PALFE|nr:sigma-54 dependent transcriptional regulator [Paludibaculum fermentans]QOY90711.1 sigma-54-dependent Fis family transcriptional regulator [Paludibaculum fermentans]
MNVECDRRAYLGLDVVFASPRIRALLKQAEQVAATNAVVLITGESGSGKEVIARAIHHHSQRRSKSWVDINCTALPEHLVESELFGYERGAFSGAEASKAGLFEIAHEGTLFLDEIGDLDPRVQVKLLRILDGAPYYRLGGVKKVNVDVRLVTATNQDLKAAAGQGRFRLDLYHRLSQIRLSVPPLRERREDILPLAAHFIQTQRAGLGISRGAALALEGYEWPGNIRELRNVMIRAAVFAQGGEITVDDLPEEFQQDGFSASLVNLSMLGEAERDVIAQVLEKTGGHQQLAAKTLGISRRTLQRRIKSYGLCVERNALVRVGSHAG